MMMMDRQNQNRGHTLIQVNSDDWLPHSCLFTNDHLRGFIAESGVVFNFVQRITKAQEPLNNVEMIKASRKYRSVIHSWYLKVIDEIAQQSKNDNNEEIDENLVRQSKVLHQMEIAWHLCEILYINISSAGTLLLQLLNWIKWHFTYYVRLADEMIVADSPQMHEHYWDIIIFFALRGDMENAALLLELHSESKIDPIFMIVQDLLKKFPVMKNNSFVIHEHYLLWGFWHDNVKQALINQSNNFNNQKRSHQHLKLLLQLMTGDLESFKLVSHLFHSWYQMMVSYALFTDPCLKGDVEILIEKTINAYYESSNHGNNESSPTLFDELIRSSFNYDLIDVIKHGSLCFDDNWWFVTHFVDLIYNSANFNEYPIADIRLIRDSFVINYANGLFLRRRFWQLSFEYLLHVIKESIDSRHYILALLERLPFDTDEELQRLLVTCRRFEFNQLELSLCRQQSRKWLRSSPNSSSKLGSALFWAIRAKDKLLINHIVDKMLNQYLRSDDPSEIDSDMITNVGGSIVLSERLIFLCKYHEFRQLCQQKQYEPAVKILIDDMLTSNAIPDFFQTKVIKDCVQLMESQSNSIIPMSSYSPSPPLVLNDEQISNLLHSFENLLYRNGSQQQQSSSSKTITFTNDDHQKLWSNQFGTNKIDRIGPNQENRINDDNDDRGHIRCLEKQLRVAAAHHLANHFVL